MGLMQEGLRRTLGTGEIRNALHPVNLNPSEIKINRLPIAKHGLEVKIREILRMFSLEQKEGEERELKPQEASKNGFEPFVNPKPSDDPLFINGYNGNFVQKMELNRKGIERVLKIAHLDGQVFLTSLSPNRQTSIEANPDGSVSAKRFTFFGEKTKEDQKDNPLSRVVAVPQGWRIEINDAKIIEDLNEKKLTGEKRQKTFIKKFSQLLNTSLFECIRKEKMTGIKDEHFRQKVFISVINPAIGLSIWAPTFQLGLLSAIAGLTSTYFAVNVFINLVGSSPRKEMERPDANFSDYRERKLDARWEYFMPLVEIDKVVRAWTFLSLKGKKLVREADSETK